MVERWFVAWVNIGGKATPEAWGFASVHWQETTLAPAGFRDLNSIQILGKTTSIMCQLCQQANGLYFQDHSNSRLNIKSLNRWRAKAWENPTNSFVLGARRNLLTLVYSPVSHWIPSCPPRWMGNAVSLHLSPHILVRAADVWHKVKPQWTLAALSHVCPRVWQPLGRYVCLDSWRHFRNLWQSILGEVGSLIYQE